MSSKSVDLFLLVSWQIRLSELCTVCSKILLFACQRLFSFIVGGHNMRVALRQILDADQLYHIGSQR